MERLRFTNADGASITFTSKFPYLLGEEISGISEAPVSIQADRAYGLHGGIYYETMYEPRLPKFDFWFSATSHAGLHTARRTIQSVLNPALGEGVLQYTNDVSTYRIGAVVADGPVMLSGPDNRGLLAQHGEVAFMCLQPFWESYIEYSQMIVGLSGGLEFPLEFPISFATTADALEIDNTGDVETPVRIEFRGPATGCKIAHAESGRFIDVTYTLAADEKLVIDTNPWAPSVTFIDDEGAETAANNKISATSRLFQLAKGTNTLSFTAATGTPEVYLYYRLRYAGV